MFQASSTDIVPGRTNIEKEFFGNLQTGRPDLNATDLLLSFALQGYHTSGAAKKAVTEIASDFINCYCSQPIRDQIVQYAVQQIEQYATFIKKKGDYTVLNKTELIGQYASSLQQAMLRIRKIEEHQDLEKAFFLHLYLWHQRCERFSPNLPEHSISRALQLQSKKKDSPVGDDATLSALYYLIGRECDLQIQLYHTHPDDDSNIKIIPAVLSGPQRSLAVPIDVTHKYEFAEDYDLKRCTPISPWDLLSEIALRRGKADQEEKGLVNEKTLLEANIFTPQHISTLHATACYYKTRGQYKKAIALLENAIQRAEPSGKAIHLSLEMAEIFVNDKQYEKAKDELVNLFKFEPIKQKAKAHYLLGVTYFHLEKLDDAVSVLKNALNHGETPATYAMLARAYGKQGEKKAALHAIKKIEELDPENTAINELRERILQL